MQPLKRVFDFVRKQCPWLDSRKYQLQREIRAEWEAFHQRDKASMLAKVSKKDRDSDYDEFRQVNLRILESELTPLEDQELIHLAANFDIELTDLPKDLDVWEQDFYGPVLSNGAKIELQRRIRAARKERSKDFRERVTFWSVIVFGLIGTLSSAAPQIKDLLVSLIAELKK
jgi:hypothetical protein